MSIHTHPLTAMFTPTDTDRNRLEVLGELLHELSDGEGWKTPHHNYDTLEITARLSDLDPASQRAVRANLSDDYADAARALESLHEGGHDVEDLFRAARDLRRIENGSKDLAAGAQPKQE